MVSVRLRLFFQFTYVHYCICSKKLSATPLVVFFFKFTESHYMIPKDKKVKKVSTLSKMFKQMSLLPSLIIPNTWMLLLIHTIPYFESEAVSVYTTELKWNTCTRVVPVNYRLCSPTKNYHVYCIQILIIVRCNTC